MFARSLIVVATVAALTMPAMAATSYWVAKDAATKKCSVVEKKPDGKTMMLIGKAKYKTMADANKAMAAAADCKY
ncbi:MAG: hypothetical protein HY245_15755 [Rhizobiales bacterium]|nr:hypothetical protein [Hyphomicrobiales bacterium]MBI3674838.1 hypothetical protein [Hyphomicrobiales bacterium]